MAMTQSIVELATLPPKLLSGELRVPVSCTSTGVPTKLVEAKP